MTGRAVRFVGVPVPSPFDYVSHVVGLGSAFKVVGVDAGAVVAAVPDYWWEVEVGEVEREAVCGPVFWFEVDLTVAVASA